jgi:transcriptional regulator with XRE-family HTH domain
MQLTEEDLYRLFGQKVREQRARLGLNQAEVAQLIGLARGSVANIETGRQRIPLHHVYALADALGVDIYTLLPSEKGERREPAIQSAMNLSQRERHTVTHVMRFLSTSDRENE